MSIEIKMMCEEVRPRLGSKKRRFEGGNSWDTVSRIVKYITANSAANGGRNQNKK